MRALSLVAIATGCVSSNVVPCSNGQICPSGELCDTVHDLCITQSQLDACANLAESAKCTTPDPGSCHDGVCLAAACGNGRVDFGELCDDGDLIDTNGCSADCMSDNRCGNGILDVGKGETCDDSNHLDHDGCSSTCELEQPHWIERPVSPPPRRTAGAFDPRRGRLTIFSGTSPVPDTWEWQGGWFATRTTAHPPLTDRAATAYDAKRARFVVFGGEYSVDSPETWEWDGVIWTRASDGPPRSTFAMVYDAKRERLVSFGGKKEDNSGAGPSVLADTLVRTDGTWSTLPVSGPSAREGAAMAYDPARDRVVLYGGSEQPLIAGGIVDDLWEFDGAAWHAIPQPTVHPPKLVEATMTWDPTRRAVVMFGGFTTDGTSVTPSDALWMWNGTTWSELPAATRPPARADAVLVSDGTRLVMFGGDDSSFLGDTWFYDTAWYPAPTPTPRSSAGTANDLGRGRVVTSGGSIPPNYTPTDETWELARDGWHSFAGAKPSARNGVALVYDAARGVTVAYGGSSLTNAPLDETWTFDGLAWKQQTPAASPARQLFASAYDPIGRVVLLFGGSVGIGPPHTPAETWSWDGTTWKIVATTGPSPRAYATMATDFVTGQIILFGGGSMTGPLADTWAWSGSMWTQLTPTFSPPASGSSVMAWNPARRAVTLVDQDLDVWEWDRTHVTWQQIFTPTSPPVSARLGASLYATPEGAGVVLGISAGSDTMWELRWDAARGSETCSGSDLDGDMLSGCMDPDCWSVCTPSCLPGATCDATAPHCGDGTCDAIESCATCPADCACTDVCGDLVCGASEATSCPGDCP